MAKKKSQDGAQKEQPEKTPSQLLADFLDQYSLYIEVAPPTIRRITDGGLIIEPGDVTIKRK